MVATMKKMHQGPLDDPNAMILCYVGCLLVAVIGAIGGCIKMYQNIQQPPAQVESATHSRD